MQRGINLHMEKRPKKRVAAIIIILAAIAYLTMTNTEFLFGERDRTLSLSPEQVQLTNWEQLSNGTYVSGGDPQIVIADINASVGTVIIECEISGLSPRVFYTIEAGQEFSGDKSVDPKYTYEDGVLTLTMNRKVADLRIDLVEEAGVSLALTGVEVNYSLPFNFNPVVAIAGMFVLIILILPFYLPRNFVARINATKDSFLRYRHLLYNLIHRDIVTKYRRSALGMLWSVLNPLLMMMVITAVFQEFFRIQVDDFPLYYLTGALIYNYVAEATSTSMTSILDASSLIKKVYIPKYIFPIEKCLSAFVNMLFSLIAVFLMFVILRFQPSWTMVLIFIPMIYVMLFSIGLGMILASMNVFFRDVAHLYSVWLTAWMYLTPIIYPINILPDIVQSVIKFNPLYYYVTYFRDLTMYNTIPGLELNMICLFFSCGFLLAGLIMFKSNQDKFILHI